MKAYGGARAMKYEHRCPSAFGELMRRRGSGSSLEVFRSLGPRLHELAFRYSAGLEGVACVIAGAYTVRELEENVGFARDLCELNAEERRLLDQAGREAAVVLGEHYGPRA